MMYLLDTHVLLWWFDDPLILSSEAFEIIRNTKNSIFVSSVSTWEIVVKKSLGKLKIPDRLFELVTEEQFIELPVRISHTRTLEKLPTHHTDPFDRLLIAQAQTEDFIFITRDTLIKKYPLRIVEA